MKMNTILLLCEYFDQPIISRSAPPPPLLQLPAASTINRNAFSSSPSDPTKGPPTFVGVTVHVFDIPAIVFWGSDTFTHVVGLPYACESAGCVDNQPCRLLVVSWDQAGMKQDELGKSCNRKLGTGPMPHSVLV
ncbi:hypothetical protein VOLCADRAFT_100975 [Volvox carteri f. nagariensis]|uniref:Uncharacterized protein n=1 Tax=Volvox carteri f. nagariensis TaxID=3068 RepID=D8ULG4_VOLCA|nr:uncharacterized protein VOLCADRAFT_100975 [Volvox carteri f. nagariensis]EFJ39436.1 hypothetical protein VOLCADRAFT_100975 [Volvox carteri f. nagariensis]|eukprot:XP_002959500.1 hypothetical protein VOLCADRAFT_100975 [Volvox carteri f. nagariensis]